MMMISITICKKGKYTSTINNQIFFLNKHNHNTTTVHIIYITTPLFVTETII